MRFVVVVVVVVAVVVAIAVFVIHADVSFLYDWLFDAEQEKNVPQGEVVRPLIFLPPPPPPPTHHLRNTIPNSERLHLTCDVRLLQDRHRWRTRRLSEAPSLKQACYRSEGV